MGIFANNPIPLKTTRGRMGITKGGGFYLLGVQILSVFCLLCWSLSTTFFLLWIINKVIPIRMSVHEELLGADLTEHKIRHSAIGVSRAISALVHQDRQLQTLASIPRVGQNPGHQNVIEEIRQVSLLSFIKGFVCQLI